MNNNNYIYPAIFTYDSDGINISFPDLPSAITCAVDDYEAVKNAKEILSLTLSDFEDEAKEIPTPSPLSSIKLNKNQSVCMIEVWMPYHRAFIKTSYVKKTLTIPNWLNILAEHSKINFSATLQEALKNKLNLK